MKLTFYILIIGFILGCSEPNNKELIIENCDYYLQLIQGSDTVPKIGFDLVKNRELTLEYLKSTYNYSPFKGRFYYTSNIANISNLKLMYLPPPWSILGISNRDCFEILINKNEEFMIESDMSSLNDLERILTKYLINNYSSYSCIWIALDSNQKEELIYSTIQKIITAFQNSGDIVSTQIYGKPICELNNTEFIEFQSVYEFRLSFASGDEIEVPQKIYNDN